MAFDSLFRSLVRTQWRGIAFPCSDLQTEFTQDLARHKSPDKDGEFIEATGRGARLVTGKAHFRNGISLGAAYSNVPLFPDTFKQFEAACANRKTGELLHPLHGRMQCKVVSFKESLTAQMRDGVDVDVQWIETTETDDTQSSLSPMSQALYSAEQVDASLTVLRAKLARLNLPDSYSFFDAVRSIQAASSSLVLLQKKSLNSFRNIIQNLKEVHSAIVQTKDVALSPLRLNVDRCIASCFELERTLLVTKVTQTYYVPRAVTIGGLSARLQVTVSDLIRLNPTLANFTIIPKNTPVLYYS